MKIIILSSNEEFIEKGGGINMDVSLEHNWYLDKIDYTVTVCLISDQWGMSILIFIY